MSELKPCPFCGENGDVVEHSVYFDSIQCTNCGVAQTAYDWNHRPIEDSLRAENTRLRELLGEALPLLTHIDNNYTVKQEDEIVSRVQSELAVK